jgi:hypothetical protein
MRLPRTLHFQRTGERVRLPFLATLRRLILKDHDQVHGSVKLRFADVKSLKGKHGISPATKILIAAGALLGVGFSFWEGNSCEDRLNT